ncbi:MAG: hypothetical protein ACFFDX_11645 [Candidatus Odinarchaeota archaeon]
MSDQTNLPSEEQIKKDVEKEEKIFLRSYSKVIFFYPLFITSLILFLIQYFKGIDEPGLGAIWITVFFANLFVIAFDTSSTKFFILLLAAIILILLFTFIFHPDTIFSQVLSFEVTIKMSYQFYLSSAVILAFTFLIAWIATRFNYWKLERNEVIHKKGIFVSVVRYPTKSLRIKKEIPDIFEFLLLRSGSIHLFLGNQEMVYLDTILNINKKAKQIDYLLSYIEVEIEKNQ